MNKELEANTTVSHYRIVEKIGAGGMGEVYLAEDTKLDRKVALKILPPEFAEDKDRMSRFVREAKSASALNHPNIVTIYEIGEADGTHYIATEFIEGETLHSRLQSKNLSLKSALDIAVQISSALQAAHSANIIHRDVKPDNVMIRSDGVVKILDFGIAKLSEVLLPQGSELNIDGEAATAIKPPSTNPGMIIGTANYMSPEQAKGKEIDARSDIFSFGIVLYEMLSAKRAFGGETPLEIISSILKDEPEPIRQLSPALPREIERIVNKTLRKDRDERYQTARDLLTDLKDAKQELEFQDKLERTAAPNREESVTQMMTAPSTVEPQPATSSTEYITREVKKHKRGVALGSIVLIALLGVGVWFFFLRSSRGTAPIDSIAILPFVDENGDPGSEYLSDGLTESIINSLAQLPSLRVSPRSTVFQYKGKDTDPLKIGHDLGVRAVVTGRLRQHGDNLMVSAELLDVSDSKQVWGQQYNRKLADALAVQQEISREITDRLRLKLSGAEQRQLTRRDASNPEAYQYYLRGRYYWNRRTGGGLKKAIEQFQQAVDKDPTYALAYVGLADCYSLLEQYAGTPSSEALPKARAAADRALQIDDSLAEAHTSLGYVEWYSWQFGEAEKEYKRAIELNPNYPTAHHWYGVYLLSIGRTNEAMAEIKRAQQLDPLSPIIAINVGLLYLLKGDLSAATEEYKKVLDLDPNFPRVHDDLGYVYLKQGREQEAVSELQKAVEVSGRASQELAYLGYGYGIVGRRAEAMAVLTELQEKYARRESAAVNLAAVYGGLGDKDQAFAWLERDFQARTGLLIFITILPDYDTLRGDPRFADLLQRMGIP